MSGLSVFTRSSASCPFTADPNSIVSAAASIHRETMPRITDESSTTRTLIASVPCAEAVVREAKTWLISRVFL